MPGRFGAPFKPVEYLPAILNNIRLGMPLEFASRAAGVSPDTLARWRKRDAKIADAVSQAESEFVQRALAIIEKAGADGSWQALAWKLERRFPNVFGQKYQHVMNQPIEVKHSGTVTHRVREDDRLRAVISILAKAGVLESVVPGAGPVIDAEVDPVHPAQSNGEATGVPALAAP